MIFLDTNAVLEILNKNTSIKDIIENQLESIAITSISIFEIYCGICYYREKGWKSPQETLLSKLKLFDQYDYSIEAAKESAKIWAYLKAEGNMISTSDIMIAGIIQTNNSNKIISNDTHFENIKDLIVYTY